MSRVLAAAPAEPIAVPRAIAQLAGDAQITAVWRNLADGTTFRLDEPGGRSSGARFAKWSPLSPEGAPVIDLGAETARLRWLATTPLRDHVPRIVADGSDNEGQWLVTDALRDSTGATGSSAVDARWSSNPHVVARAMGEGLRVLHTALDPGACPFDWSVPARLAAAGLAPDAGAPPARGAFSTPSASATSAIEQLGAPPPADRIVVCHGDPCAPNTLLSSHGSWLGIVDCGTVGTADRWADLAVATWSLAWNFGDEVAPTLERSFFDHYGVEPDPERIAYYRRLWDLT